MDGQGCCWSSSSHYSVYPSTCIELAQPTIVDCSGSVGIFVCPVSSQALTHIHCSRRKEECGGIKAVTVYPLTARTSNESCYSSSFSFSFTFAQNSTSHGHGQCMAKWPSPDKRTLFCLYLKQQTQSPVKLAKKLKVEQSGMNKF